MSPPPSFSLENSVLKARFRMDEQGMVYLEQITNLTSDNQNSTRVHPPSRNFKHSSIPIVQIRLNGQGNETLADKTGKSLINGISTFGFRYRSHKLKKDETTRTQALDIELHDPKIDITLISHWVLYDNSPVLRSSTTIQNDSNDSIIVTQLTSMAFGGLVSGPKWWNEYELSIGNNTWLREAQWVDMSFPRIGLCDYGLYSRPASENQRTLGSMQTFGLSNRTTFSTQGHLPMGLIERKDKSEAWVWQIENNGGWRWEVGDYKDSIYLATTGPEASNHDWFYKLDPKASYTTCTTSLVHVDQGGRDQAFAELTKYRRKIVRSHEDHEKLPIIFNDYMNCLMGDPTEEKILALVDPVVKSGAEYFVIDAGWYAENNDWWEDVGEWEPSHWRFPRGFAWLVGEIRRKGLKTGCWIEPEVIGVKSKMVEKLPNEAFFMRHGNKLIEKGRYQLDYRHPEVIKRMDMVIDKLVQDYGIQYFKFDYNIEVVLGTDTNCFSAGVGQEGHSRAYLAWIDRLLDRYPGLVIENCSSGAMRMEYGMLSIHTLQSTSDQENPILYSAIAAALPTAVIPEQSATWAYPQPNWSDEINALTVVNSLLGRIHLSGRLDQMSANQLELVYEGMTVYSKLRKGMREFIPFWPLGLPLWEDDWIALGMMDSKNNGVVECWLSVWRRGGSTKMSLPIPLLKNTKGKVEVKVVYPTSLPANIKWDQDRGELELVLPKTVCARMCHLTVSE